MKEKTDKSRMTFVLPLVFCALTAISSLTPMQGLGQTGISSALNTEVAYQADSFRDPFKNPVKEEMAKKPENTVDMPPEIPLPELKVQGVFWGANFPQAIINDTVLKNGDQINGVIISGIEKDSITVSYNGKEYKLSSPASQDLSGSSNKERKKEDTYENQS